MLLILAPHMAHSETVEKWECKDIYSPDWDIIVEAAVHAGRTTGSISVAGVIHKSKFEIKGFDRRWDFVLQSDGTYDYALVIDPSGFGSYYELERNAMMIPSKGLKCKKNK